MDPTVLRRRPLSRTSTCSAVLALPMLWSALAGVPRPFQDPAPAAATATPGLRVDLPCREIAVHPERPWVAVAGDGVRVVHLETGEVLASLPDIRNALTDLAWLGGDGRLFACRWVMMGTTVWDAGAAVTLSNETVRGTSVGSYYAVALAPGRGWMARSSDWQVSFADSRTLEQVQGRFVSWEPRVLVEDPARCLRFSPDEGLLALGFESGHVGIFDMETEELVRTRPVDHAVTGIDLDDDGGVVIGTSSGEVWSLGADGDARLLHRHADPEKGEALATRRSELKPIGASHIRTKVMLTKDGTRAISGGDDGVVRVAELAGDGRWWSPVHAGPIRDLELTPDGRSVVSAGDDGLVVTRVDRLVARNDASPEDR